VANRFRIWFGRDDLGGLSPVLRRPSWKDEAHCARQRLSLVDPDGHDIVVGWVLLPKRTAVLRGYQQLAQLYRTHCGAELPFDESAYNSFAEKVACFLAERDVVLAIDDTLPAMRRSWSPPTAFAATLAVAS
jgi:hypothetical protein